METKKFDYDQWLSTHSKSKTMMEKLERSLIPYDLFDAIGLRNDKQERDGDVTVGDNTYHYHIAYEYNCIGHDVYEAVIEVKDLCDKWQNLMMGYHRFKVVMEHQAVKTIYSDRENYFQQVIDMFDNDDIAALYKNRSAYINNLLARYILLQLIERQRPDMHLLTTVKTREESSVFVMATTSDRKEMVMYAFSKRNAMEMAERYDGIARLLTVVYFFNQDFERDGNVSGFDSGRTVVMSARSFCMGLTNDTKERRVIERKMLWLVSMLYNEHLEWYADRIERVVVNPPFYGKHMKEQKLKIKVQRIADREKKRQDRQGLPWWQKISRTLLEDALNVLGDEPRSHSDIFHFLCAANIMNAYVNQCRQKGCFSERQMQRMFQAKTQIFKCLVRLAEEHNPNVSISVSPLPAILVNMNVGHLQFQISFRGMSNNVLKQLYEAGVDRRGKFNGYYYQPIATALYQYSYLRRWEVIK